MDDSILTADLGLSDEDKSFVDVVLGKDNANTQEEILVKLRSLLNINIKAIANIEEAFSRQKKEKPIRI